MAICLIVMKSGPTQTAVQLAPRHTPLPAENNTSRLFEDIILNLQTETNYDKILNYDCSD